MSVGTLRLCIEKARLVATDNEEESDFYPYCIVLVGKSQQRTQQAKQTLTPEWNKQYVFNVNNPDALLLVVIWNSKWIKDEFLGAAVTRLKNYRNGKPVQNWYKLKSKEQYQKIKTLLSKDIDIDPAEIFTESKPASYSDVLQQERSRGQIQLKIMFSVADKWLLPDTPTSSSLQHTGFLQSKNTADESLVLIQKTHNSEPIPRYIHVSQRRPDNFLKITFPWGQIYTKYQLPPRENAQDNEEFIKMSQSYKQQLQTQGSKLQILKTSYKKLREENHNLLSRNQMLQKQASAHERIVKDARNVSTEIVSQNSKLKEEKMDIRNALDATNLQCTKLSDEIGELKQQLKQTETLRSDEQKQLNDKLNHEKKTAEETRQKIKELSEIVETQKSQIQTGFEGRTKEAFNLDDDEVLLNIHPSSTGLVYIFSKHLCLDQFPTDESTNSNHKRFQIPFSTISTLKKKKTGKSSNARGGSIELNFHTERPSLKLNGLVDREKCIQVIVKMAQTVDNQIEIK